MLQKIRVIAKTILLIAFILSLLFLQACRQDPKKKIKYYESELREMKMARERELKNQAQNRFIKDGYPWRGKAKCSDRLPERVNSTQKSIQAELDYIGESVHGKKKCKARLRY